MGFEGRGVYMLREKRRWFIVLLLYIYIYSSTSLRYPSREAPPVPVPDSVSLALPRARSWLAVVVFSGLQVLLEHRIRVCGLLVVLVVMVMATLAGCLICDSLLRWMEGVVLGSVTVGEKIARYLCERGVVCCTQGSLGARNSRFGLARSVSPHLFTS